jgi:hypothetical protein
MTKVFISICTHRYLEPQNVECLINTLSSSSPDLLYGYSFQMEAMIDRARAMQATEFLKSGFDVLLFIDDDILWMPEDAARIAHDAIEQQSVVCGPYARKTAEGGIIAVPLKAEEFLLGDGGKLLEIRWGGTGFMAIPRNVIKAMAKTLPLVNVRKDIQIYPMFMPMIQEVNGESIDLSEDYSFCQRALNLGFKIWLDTRIRLAHIGPKLYVPGI